MLAVLRNRDFGLLWVSGLVSVAGDWILYAALPFYVYERTGSTIATAGMIVAELAPAVLLGSAAGVFVDRWDRKHVLVGANLLQAAAVSLLLLVPLDGWLWIVYAVAVAQSAVAAFAQPAESALLPTLVAEERLLAANALNALNNRLARLVGLPLGAALLGLVGLRGVVAVDCLSFVLAAFLVAPIASRRVPRERPAGDAGSAWSAFWAELRDGLRLVGRERMVALLFVVLGLMTFGGTMLDPLTVAWVRDVLGEGPEVFAWLLTAHAASGIAATLAVGRLGALISPRALIGWSSIAVAAALALRHNVPSVPLALGLTAIAGVTSVVSSVGVETLAQRAVPDEYRGRVFGSLGATLGLLSLLGASVGGTVAEAVGIVPMLNVATALIALSGVVVLRSFPRGG